MPFNRQIFFFFKKKTHSLPSFFPFSVVILIMKQKPTWSVTKMVTALMLIYLLRVLKIFQVCLFRPCVQITVAYFFCFGLVLLFFFLCYPVLPLNFHNQSSIQFTSHDSLGKLVLFQKCKIQLSVSRLLSMWQNIVSGFWSFNVGLKFLRVCCVSWSTVYKTCETDTTFHFWTMSLNISFLKFWITVFHCVRLTSYTPLVFCFFKFKPCHCLSQGNMSF